MSNIHILLIFVYGIMPNEEIATGLWKHTCRSDNCQNVWASRKEFPKNCPNCRSPYWNVAYSKKGYVKNNDTVEEKKNV